jgi:hypothetical protein
MKALLLSALIALPAAAEPQQNIPVAAQKYAPVDGAVAVPLTLDNAYFRNPGNPAYDFWALASFYIPQRNGASCSSAAAAMALNALLNARRERTDSEENIAEAGLVGKVAGIKWSGLASAEGFEGRHGLTLDQLAAGIEEAAGAYGAAGVTVGSVAVSSPTAAALDKFRRTLAGNERSPDDIMLLHFAQDALTGAAGGPYAHISPVGAYNERTRRVLIFDVDRQWYEPYWASDIQVLKAMAVKTKSFGHGGYVTLKKSAGAPVPK